MCFIKEHGNKKNGRLIIQSKCAKCGNKNSRLSNLGIKIPLNKMPLLNALF